MIVILSCLLYLVSFACFILIVIEAFKESVMKGLLCLLCGFYTLYYAFFDFEHDKKWPIIGGWLGAASLGAVLIENVR